MWRPTPRTVLVVAIVALAAASVALTVHAFTPSSATRLRPDITPATLSLPSALAVVIVQAMSYPSLGQRLAAGAVLFVLGLLGTLLVMFVLGCGFYGACSK
ncbi:MAG TPA: hypothetical protein VMT83_02370 [Burkholderiaceae bacterium]|nr:hypothetical protein [Burkholderiaceae bacterium]